ncbi:type 4a pilus biogenesis protein PilO [Endozoicomonadaceae bacterium StTr2]
MKIDLAESFRKLNELDLNDLDFENVGSWPMPAKIVSCIMALLLVLVLGYQLYLSDTLVGIEIEEGNEEQLKQAFRTKAFQAANLNAYRKQMEEMETEFAIRVRQLPSDTEVPGLLEDINFTATGSGLEISSIELQPEFAAAFHIELPIKINVQGTYHDLGNFVSGVASLSRIVTLHDFTIKPVGGDADSDLLDMEILARTYRYNDKGIVK